MSESGEDVVNQIDGIANLGEEVAKSDVPGTDVEGNKTPESPEELTQKWFGSRLRLAISGAVASGLGAKALEVYADRVATNIGGKMPLVVRINRPMEWPATPENISDYMGKIMGDPTMNHFLTETRIPEMLNNMQLAEKGVLVAAVIAVALTGYAAYEAYRSRKAKSNNLLTETDLSEAE